jgi:hypothetical protein
MMKYADFPVHSTGEYLFPVNFSLTRKVLIFGKNLSVFYRAIRN